jgi:hypothetical protein
MQSGRSFTQTERNFQRGCVTDMIKKLAHDDAGFRFAFSASSLSSVACLAIVGIASAPYMLALEGYKT